MNYPQTDIIGIQFNKIKMKTQTLILLLLIGTSTITSCSKAQSPAAIGPLPSERQLAWHQLDYYAFIHFNMNTFTNMEWGTGGESPEQFNPSQLDARQWARVAKDAGMEGIIITAKHHDGFCLWPTKTTEHSVKNAPWKNGKGDLIKELSDACKEYGLKFGIYLSPWDRNHKDYGQPEYVDDFHEQLRELLTNYGEVFEVWFDGANGGSGFYGGANETRKIDNKTYYQWDKTTAIVRELQPNAVIFSDGGPDIRWVGNEEGWANETNWSIMRRDEIYPGWPRYVELRSGHEDGTHWLPAEVNVSIRPGWYYHPSEDHQVKTLAHLVRIYYESIGRNGNFLLNLPVDDRGLVHETDVKQLMALKEQIDKDFDKDLAKETKVSASNVRGEGNDYAPQNAIDGDPETYWAANDGVTNASITMTFDQLTEVNRVLLQEYIPLGQRVKEFSVEAKLGGQWLEIDHQTTIGFKRILRFDGVKSSAIRINILQAKGAPILSNIELYRAPNLLTAPVIKRNKEGLVTLEVPDKNLKVVYGFDEGKPDVAFKEYKAPFLVDKPKLIKVMAIDPETKQESATLSKFLDISKKNWKVIDVSSGKPGDSEKMIDDDPTTFWASDEDASRPVEVAIDLGERQELSGFTYWPMQERWSFGIITEYEFFVSNDANNWRSVTKGEFSNVLNNPVEQKIVFEPVTSRFIKLKALKVKEESHRASFGEIGVITNQ